MANLVEANNFDAGVYQLETGDPVMGGAGGIANAQAQALANRTNWLKANMAPLASPQLTGDPQAPTPAQFDNDVSLATTAFVQRALGNHQGAQQLGVGAVTNLAAGDMGKYLQAQGGTINLPPNASVPAGSALVITASGSTAVARNGADTIYFGGTALTSTVVGVGDFLVLISMGGGVWEAYGSASLQYAPGFAASLGGAGWQKLPSGLIIQWGNITTAGGGATITYPIAFPVGCFAVVAAPNAGNVGVTASTGNLGATSVPVYTYNYNGTVANATVDYLAFGH